MPPVSAFDSVMMSGTDTGALAGKHCSGAGKAGEDLIEDQKEVIAIGQTAQPRKHDRIMKTHTARTLHQRFDDDARKHVRILLQQRRECSLALIIFRQIPP